MQGAQKGDGGGHAEDPVVPPAEGLRVEMRSGGCGRAGVKARARGELVSHCVGRKGAAEGLTCLLEP